MSRLTGWLLSCCLLLGIMAPGQAAVPTDFRAFAPVVGVLPPNTPVRVPLPREVIATARPGFADVRVFDDQGVDTPYVIYPQRAPPSYTVVLKVLAYSQDQEGESIVLQRPSPTGPVRALLVQTSARDFHKTVRLQSSDDQIAWHEVASGALFDFSSRLDLRQTTLPCPPIEALYLRLVLKDAVPSQSDPRSLQLRYEGLELLTRGKPTRPFRIDQIRARIGVPQRSDDIYDQATLSSPSSRSPRPGETWFDLGRLNLPLAQLTLNAENAYFHRRVEVWAADRDHDEAYQQLTSGVIYKLPGVGTAETTLHVSPRTYGYVRLKIWHGDNPPLRLQSVHITWVRHDLYFVPAAGQRYILSVGNEHIQAPVSELRHLLPDQHTKQQHYPIAALGALQPQDQYRSTLSPGATQQIAKVLLTILVLLLTVGLGWWAYRLLKVMAKPGKS